MTFLPFFVSNSQAELPLRQPACIRQAAGADSSFRLARFATAIPTPVQDIFPDAPANHWAYQIPLRSISPKFDLKVAYSYDEDVRKMPDPVTVSAVVEVRFKGTHRRPCRVT